MLDPKTMEKDVMIVVVVVLIFFFFFSARAGESHFIFSEGWANERMNELAGERMSRGWSWCLVNKNTRTIIAGFMILDEKRHKTNTFQQGRRLENTWTISKCRLENLPYSSCMTVNRCRIYSKFQSKHRKVREWMKEGTDKCEYVGAKRPGNSHKWLGDRNVESITIGERGCVWYVHTLSFNLTATAFSQVVDANVEQWQPHEKHTGKGKHKRS